MIDDRKSTPQASKAVTERVLKLLSKFSDKELDDLIDSKWSGKVIDKREERLHSLLVLWFDGCLPNIEVVKRLRTSEGEPLNLYPPT